MNAPLRYVLLSMLACSLLAPGCVSHSGLIMLNENGIRYADNPENTLRIPDSVDTSGPARFGAIPLETYRVRPYDNLIIRLNTNEESSVTFFNGETAGGNGGGQAIFSPAGLYLASHAVDANGLVELPLIGAVDVAGMTLAEIKLEIDELLKPHVLKPFTIVKLANFRVTVMGEVSRPGVQYVYNDRHTVYQAIAEAGDFTEYADRSRIKLVRELKSQTEVVYLDFAKKTPINTEYFFMMPGDVIYVEPVKAKALEINSRSLSLLLSAISVTSLVANIIISNANQPR